MFLAMTLAIDIEKGTDAQIAAGEYTVQAGGEHGAVVLVAPPGSQPAPRPRSLPILQRPSAVRGFVDREEELAAALDAIADGTPVGINGPPGIGKSSLLRQLAHAPEVGTLPDGVVYLSARQQPGEDLLQALFEAFYDCDIPFRPNHLQAREFLKGKRALVLLDDGELRPEEAEDLLDSAPDCAFAMATRERCLWRECRSVALAGLPPDDARALFERELGRSLADEETEAFESLLARLGGHPLRLLQAAGQLRQDRPIEEVEGVEESTARQTLAPLPDEEKRLLSALATVGGGPVEAGLLAALADVTDPRPALEALVEQKLIRAHSPRYSLTGDLDAVLPSIWDISPWGERALAYFLSWAEPRREDPAALLEEAGTLRHLVDWAARTGKHAEMLRLGRILDNALMLSGRWGAWGQVLERVRDAAAAVGDRAAEAWALHQLGTRLLCLDDKAAARPLLSRALTLRKSLGDREGAEVTRHNLGLLGPAPRRIGRYALPYRFLPWLALALLALIVVGVRLVSSGMGGGGLERRQPEAPVPREAAPPLPATPLPPASIEETSDLTSGMTEPTMTDLPAETETGEPLLDIPRTVGFPTVTLGEAGSEQAKRISMTNAGATPLRVNGVSFIENPGQAFTLRTDCARASVAPGERCSILIVFDPPAAGSYRGVLAIDAERLGQIRVETSGTAREPLRPPTPREPPERLEPQAQQGWCCLDGEVYRSPQSACADEEGSFFLRQRAAIAACLITGCCVDGEFRLGESREMCEEIGGIFMAATEVPLRCR